MLSTTMQQQQQQQPICGSVVDVARERDEGALRALCQPCSVSGELTEARKACVLVTIYRRESDLFALLLRENRDLSDSFTAAAAGRGGGRRAGSGLMVLCDMSLDDGVHLEPQSAPLVVKVVSTCGQKSAYLLEFGRAMDLATFQRAFSAARGYFRQMLTLRTLVADSFWQGFASGAEAPVRNEPHGPPSEALKPPPGVITGQPEAGLRGKTEGPGALGLDAETLATQIVDLCASSGTGGFNAGAGASSSRAAGSKLLSSSSSSSSTSRGGKPGVSGGGQSSSGITKGAAAATAIVVAKWPGAAGAGQRRANNRGGGSAEPGIKGPIAIGDPSGSLTQYLPAPQLTHYEGLFAKYLQSLPALERVSTTEDVCFLCKEGGNLVECDEGTSWFRRVKAKREALGKPPPLPGAATSCCGVPMEEPGHDGAEGAMETMEGGGRLVKAARCKKVYHAYCMGFNVADDELSSCPRHACVDCGERADYFCRFCPVSLCHAHFRTNSSGMVAETYESLKHRVRRPFPRTRGGGFGPKTTPLGGGAGRGHPGLKGKDGRARRGRGGRGGIRKSGATIAQRWPKRSQTAVPVAVPVGSGGRGGCGDGGSGCGGGDGRSRGVGEPGGGAGFGENNFVCSGCKMATRRAVRQYGLLGSLETGGVVLPYGESEESGDESESDIIPVSALPPRDAAAAPAVGVASSAGGNNNNNAVCSSRANGGVDEEVLGRASGSIEASGTGPAGEPEGGQGTGDGASSRSSSIGASSSRVVAGVDFAVGGGGAAAAAAAATAVQSTTAAAALAANAAAAMAAEKYFSMFSQREPPVTPELPNGGGGGGGPVEDSEAGGGGGRGGESDIQEG